MISKHVVFYIAGGKFLKRLQLLFATSEIVSLRAEFSIFLSDYFIDVKEVFRYYRVSFF